MIKTIVVDVENLIINIFFKNMGVEQARSQEGGIWETKNVSIS